MTRKEQIEEASVTYQISKRPNAIGGDAFADIVYKANINLSFIAGAEWADKTMIEKACEWLTLNIGMLLKVLNVEYNTDKTDINDFIKDFKQAMEE